MTSHNPYQTFQFILSIDGIEAAHFAEASGLSDSVEQVDFREGSDSLSAPKLPSMMAQSPITLKRGLATSVPFRDWILRNLEGNLERKNIEISLLSTDVSEAIVRWKIYEAWPQSCDLAKISSDSSESAIASLELSYTRLESVK